MTVNRRAFLTPQKTWHWVQWTRRSPVNNWKEWDAARDWCSEHVGVFRGDWDIEWGPPKKFKFRDPDVALLFQLTWC